MEFKEAGSPDLAEVKKLIGDMATAWEAYKEKNDKRLSQVESKGSSDVVTVEELKKLDEAQDQLKKRLDELAVAPHRPVIGDGDQKREMTEVEVKHRDAWQDYVRKGRADGLTELEAKALSVGSNTDGGYTVPVTVESNINRIVTEVSPIREISGNITISGTIYKKPVNLGGSSYGWVGEAGSRSETTPPSLGELVFPVHEIYAMPAATQSLLDDSAVNIETWLADECRLTFAQQEGRSFINGNGVAKPRGFLSYPIVADSSYAWGSLGYVASGGASDFASSNPSDPLVELIYRLMGAYRSNGKWLMNRFTMASVRKFKDSSGNYIWQPGLVSGQPATLLSYPVVEAEGMPDVGANAYPIAFGDFRSGYLVVDRVGIRVLRDPFSSKPYVMFYTTKRVGGGVQNFEAIKLLKIAAS